MTATPAPTPEPGGAGLLPGRVLVAIVVVVLGGVLSLPTDLRTNQAIQCLSE